MDKMPMAVRGGYARTHLDTCLEAEMWFGTVSLASGSIYTRIQTQPLTNTLYARRRLESTAQGRDGRIELSLAYKGAAIQQI